MVDPSSGTHTSLLDEDFLARLERLSLVSRATILGKIRGERRSRKRGFSTEFADYRDYVPGDDLRYLDWNIFGRLERLFIKLFHEEEDLTVSILVDASSSMCEGNPPKLRYACQVAAALSYIALAAEDRVGIYPFTEGLEPPFRPVRGKRNARRVFKYLGDLATPREGEPRPTDLDRALRSFAHGFGRRGMVVLISDLLDPQGFEEGLRAISGNQLETFVIQLLSPQEREPELAGDVRLVDCEDAAAVEVSINRHLLRAYREAVERFRQEVRDACARRDIIPIFATTSTPFEHLVLGYLRSRGLVR